MMSSEADTQFSQGRYAQALALYEAAAEVGDAEAGEIAGYMLYFGPALFGPQVPCDRQRARRWLAMAAGDGRLLAQMMVRRLDGEQPAPGEALPTIRIPFPQATYGIVMQGHEQALAKASTYMPVGRTGDRLDRPTTSLQPPVVAS